MSGTWLPARRSLRPDVHEGLVELHVVVKSLYSNSDGTHRKGWHYPPSAVLPVPEGSFIRQGTFLALNAQQRSLRLTPLPNVPVLVETGQHFIAAMKVHAKRVLPRREDGSIGDDGNLHEDTITIQVQRSMFHRLEVLTGFGDDSLQLVTGELVAENGDRTTVLQDLRDALLYRAIRLVLNDDPAAWAAFRTGAPARLAAGSGPRGDLGGPRRDGGANSSVSTAQREISATRARAVVQQIPRGPGPSLVPRAPQVSRALRPVALRPQIASQVVKQVGARPSARINRLPSESSAAHRSNMSRPVSLGKFANIRLH